MPNQTDPWTLSTADWIVVFWKSGVFSYEQCHELAVIMLAGLQESIDA